mmetsp:Transcript_68533/g.151766  ORF Transcript_68533/g.151766 Transcript_68533/m.151766 type:complete len:242 (+) Transcript_68533:310-1035(+)
MRRAMVAASPRQSRGSTLSRVSPRSSAKACSSKVTTPCGSKSEASRTSTSAARRDAGTPRRSQRRTSVSASLAAAARRSGWRTASRRGKSVPSNRSSGSLRMGSRTSVMRPALTAATSAASLSGGARSIMASLPGGTPFTTSARVRASKTRSSASNALWSSKEFNKGTTTDTRRFRLTSRRSSGSASLSASSGKAPHRSWAAAAAVRLSKATTLPGYTKVARLRSQGCFRNSAAVEQGPSR